MEYLDVIDENGNKTGETVSHHDAHAKGILHRAIHVWLVNKSGQILVQRRSPSMVAYPNLWDASASGHVSAGQTDREAAIREVYEEIGLKISQDRLQSLFTRNQNDILNGGTYINHEIDEIFLVEADITENDIHIDHKEVSDAKFLDIDTFEDWVNGKGEELVPHNEEYRRVLEYLKSRKS